MDAATKAKLAEATDDSSMGSGTISETSSAVITAAYVRPVLGPWRKNTMLFLFCFAEFMDAFIASALFPAIPILESVLGVDEDLVAWVFAAYSCTFSAFLLISGRFSDVYSASKCPLSCFRVGYRDSYIPFFVEFSFIIGAIIIGAFSLGGGFVKQGDDKVFFLLRALAGKLFRIHS